MGQSRAAAIASPTEVADAAAIPAGLVVVTIAHHSGAVLPGLATDLARQSRPPLAWLVVDNSPVSAPLAVADLQREGLVLRPLRGAEGEGFGAGCNRALGGKLLEGWRGWVWLLNPDTSLPRGDEVAQLQAALARVPPTALVGTAVVEAEGGLEASGGWIDAGLAFRRRRLQPAQAQGSEPLALDWLSGCSLALQPEAHRPPARFDPAFPLYYEDMDLCLRLRRRGAPVLWLPEPAVRHRRGTGSASGGCRRLRLSSLGYLRFLRRHCAGWVFVLRTGRLLLLTLLRLPLRPHRSAAVLAALGSVLGEMLRGVPS